MRDVERQRVPLGLDERAGHLDRLGHRGVDLDALALQRDATLTDARDVEQVVDEPAHVIDLPLDDAALALARIGMAHAQELQRRQDRRQRVAQLVPEHGQELVLGAAGHLRFRARLPFARQQLPALLLLALAVADVGEGGSGGDDAPFAVADGRGAGRDDPARAVGGGDGQLLVEQPLTGQRAQERMLVRLQGPPVGVRGDELRRLARARALRHRAVAEEAAQLLVDDDDALARRVGDEHARRHLRHHRLQEPARRRELQPRPHLRRHVERHRHDAEQGAGRVAQRLAGELEDALFDATAADVERHRIFLGGERLAAAIDLAQHGEHRRIGRQLGKDLRHRATGEVASSDHAFVERVR